MKKIEVPQDNENLLEEIGGEIQYATDEDGKYIQVQSTGWLPKNTILKEEWDKIDLIAEHARQEVINGHKSALYFHMTVHQMNVKMLAGYANMTRFKVKRLLKPERFKSMNAKEAKKLAYALNIKQEELMKIPEQPVCSLQKNETGE